MSSVFEIHFEIFLWCTPQNEKAMTAQCQAQLVMYKLLRKMGVYTIA